MPIQIIEKQKTEPRTVQGHKSLVPLRVVKFRGVHKEELHDCKVGEILVCIPRCGGGEEVLNATTGKIMNRMRLDDVLCVRAYDVQSIVVCNDNEPAPVV